MSSVADLSSRRATPALGSFERYLTLWVALCIIAGVLLGQLMPAPFQALGRMNVAEVNIPVALLIWLMIVPMLLKVDFGALHRVAEQWRGIAVTVGVNWLVKPFSMALLGWLFVGWLFRPWLPAAQIDSYIAGLIILAAAPCTAMVFVWSNLRSEEHTSELQSRFDLVCRLLLEKKKTNTDCPAGLSHITGYRLPGLYCTAGRVPP